MTTEIHNTNKSCCTIEPVLDDTYVAKGDYKAIGTFKKAYIVGDRSRGKVIITAYDAFGYTSQTLQAADIIAKSINGQVIIPDFFDGNTADPAWFVDMESEGSQRKLQAWFGTSANFANHIPALQTLAGTLKAESDVKIGSLGYCWGGKLVTISGTENSNLDAIASVHPARVDRADAAKLTVPIALFPSNGEDEKESEAFMEALKDKLFASKCQYKYYGTVHHGWAASRANLKDEENLKEYKDVYERLGHFFNEVL